MTKSQILKIVLSAGFNITPKALKLIEKLTEPEKTIAKIIEQEMLLREDYVITEEHLKKYIIEDNEKQTESQVELAGPRSVKFLAQEYDSEIKIIKDPTDKLESTGTYDDFRKYFLDRFERLSKIYKERPDTRNTRTIEDLKNEKISTDSKLIGMVYEKRETKAKNIMLTLDDPTGSITAIIPKGDKNLEEKAKLIVEDSVLCFEGRITREGIFIVKEIILPDIPVVREIKRAPVNLSAVFVSDTHIGSKEFLSKVFEQFIKWLNGKTGTKREQDIARTIKYVVFGGDNVDGIGVYPNQEKDLEITSIYEQFRVFSKYIDEIPDHISIIVIPGNHDGIRRALPQPAIPKDFAEPIYESSKDVYMLGNPTYYKLHGVDVLTYHGDSFDDFTKKILGATYEAPAEMMIEMLKLRHMAPIYGERTGIAPEAKDWLAIDNIPEIFHTGHAHHNDLKRYRNVLCINSGTFQSQTEYMKSQGVIPTPGIVTVVNLKTLKPTIIKF